jgi:hypothetical protein
MFVSFACRGHWVQSQDGSLRLLPCGSGEALDCRCNHGCCDEAVVAGRDDKWHDVGPLDPVKAILIMNE